MKHFALLATLACPSFAFAQDAVAVFNGPAGGVGTITLHDAATGAQLAALPEWVGLKLLNIDFCARTALQEFLSTRPRYLAEAGGSSRLRLQQDRGSLYHFERPTAGGPSSFGYLLVPTGAAPRILIELAGTGVTGTTDPFFERVGVAPDGGAFLAATTPAAGGDLLEISTLPVANPVVPRSPTLPPLPLLPDSLMLGPNYGVAVTTRGVVRFDRTTTNELRRVPFLLGERPNLYTGEIVQSVNTSFACFTAGASSQLLDVFTVGATGPARRATQAPDAISGAGSAQDAPDGPYLAVSDDGQWCAWRSEVLLPTTSHECFVNRVAAPIVDVPEQLSSNTNFTDTLDEVALFAFNPTGKLTFAVGERALVPTAPIENLDVFAATPQPGQPAMIANLSLSSGDTALPFLAIPTLKPTRTALLPDGSATLLHNDSGGGGGGGGGGGELLLMREGVSGAQVLDSNVRELLYLDFAGPFAMLNVRRSGSGGLHELLRVNPSVPTVTTVITSGSSAMIVDRSAPRSDGWMAYVLQDGGAETVQRTLLSSGATNVATGVGGPAGAVVGWSAQGRTLFTSLAGGTWTHTAWSLGGTPTTFATTATESRLLLAN